MLIDAYTFLALTLTKSDIHSFSLVYLLVLSGTFDKPRLVLNIILH